MNRILLCALIAFIGSHASATTIKDPNDVLGRADQFLAAPSFEENLKCGSTALFTQLIQDCQYECGEFGCGGICTGINNDITRTVSECTPDGVKIFGEDGLILDISRTLHEQTHGNLARPFLAQLEAFIQAKGEITLDRATPTTYKLAPNTPQEKALPAVNIEGRFRLDGTTPGDMDLLVTLVKGTPGVAQIARFRIMNETYFRLKEVQ